MIVLLTDLDPAYHQIIDALKLDCQPSSKLFITV